MSLIDWMNRPVKFIVRYSTHSSRWEGVGYVYVATVNADSFEGQLNFFGSNTMEKREAILQTNSNLENILHRLFSGKLFSELKSKDFIIPESRVSDVNKDLCECGLIHLSAEAPSSGKNLSRAKVEMNALQYAEKEVIKIIQKIFSLYENDEPALIKALMIKDSNGNTPLYLAFKQLTSSELMVNILKLISKFHPTHLNQLILTPNENNSRVIEILIERWYLTSFRLKDIFHLTNLEEVLSHRDSHQQSLLHTIVQGYRNTKHMTDLYDVMHETKEQKVDKNEHLYCQDDQGRNPFHLLMKQSDKNTPEQKLTFVSQMLSLIFPETRFKKLIELNAKGQTPLECAILDFYYIQALLKNFNPVERKKLILFANKDGFTLLHSATKQNISTFKMLAEAIGPLDFYLLRRGSPSLDKEVAGNPHMKQEYADFVNEYNTLFEIFDYFVHDKENGSIKEPLIKDFQNCLLALKNRGEEDVYLPREPQKFRSKSPLFQSEKYHSKRIHLAKISPQEIDQFIVFLNEKNRSTNLKEKTLAGELLKEINNNIELTPIPLVRRTISA